MIRLNWSSVVNLALLSCQQSAELEVFSTHMVLLVSEVVGMSSSLHADCQIKMEWVKADSEFLPY